MRKRLLKDIIIPAGTVFTDAPSKTQRTVGEHIDCIIGLTPNTAGSFTYDANNDELVEWFEDCEA